MLENRALLCEPWEGEEGCGEGDGRQRRKDSKVTLLQHMLACCRDCECNLIEHACEKVQDLLRGTPRKVAKEFSTRLKRSVFLSKSNIKWRMPVFFAIYA